MYSACVNKCTLTSTAPFLLRNLDKPDTVSRLYHRIFEDKFNLTLISCLHLFFKWYYDKIFYSLYNLLPYSYEKIRFVMVKKKIYITPAHLFKNFWFAPQKNNTFSLVLLVWTGSFGTITTIINSDIYYTCTLWKGRECRSGRSKVIGRNLFGIWLNV